MNKKIVVIVALIFSFAGGFFLSKIGCEKFEGPERTEIRDTIISNKEKLRKQTVVEESNIKLGAFSISLNVKDLKASRLFYEKLGFMANGGGIEMSYLIMKNENALIGLFQGMFEGNILTFNPGWNENAENIEYFNDVRIIQKKLKENTIELISEASDTTEGPASLMLKDPDGNLILIDQHR